MVSSLPGFQTPIQPAPTSPPAPKVSLCPSALPRSPGARVQPAGGGGSCAVSRGALGTDREGGYGSSG